MVEKSSVFVSVHVGRFPLSASVWLLRRFSSKIVDVGVCFGKVK